MFSCLFFRQREKPSKVDCDNTDGLEVQVLSVAARGLAPPTHVQKQKHLWTPGSIPEVKETTFPGGKCDLRPPPTHKSGRDLGPPHGTSKCRPRFNQMTRRRLTCSRRAISFALPHSSTAKLKHPMCEIVPPRQQIKPSVITSVNLVFK